jgi:regulator of sirC expression with transglutaminase-like and TPR domain
MPFETPTPSSGIRKRSLALAAALLALLAVAPSQAARKTPTGTVKGTVTTRAGGDELSGVEITLTGPGGVQETTTTDRRGRFSIKVPAGDYVIGLAAEGHAPFEAKLAVQPGTTQVVEVELLDEAEGRRGEAAQLYNAGVGALQAGDTAAAKESLLAAVEVDPALLEAHRVLARIYVDERAWAQAAREAETLLAARPEDNQFLRLAYAAYRGLDDPRVTEVRRALAADPELAKALAVHAFNEGAVAEQNGAADTAESRFREALDLDPELAAAHFALASHEYRADRYDAALTAVGKGLELEPASAQGRRLVFISLDAKGDAEAAERAMDAYAEVDATGAVGILYTRGEQAFLNNENEQAMTAFSRILEYQPDHPHAHRALGLVYASTDAALAREHLGRFLELAPDDPEAPTVREILGAL